MRTEIGAYGRYDHTATHPIQRIVKPAMEGLPSILAGPIFVPDVRYPAAIAKDRFWPIAAGRGGLHPTHSRSAAAEFDQMQPLTIDFCLRRWVATK